MMVKLGIYMFVVALTYNAVLWAEPLHEMKPRSIYKEEENLVPDFTHCLGKKGYLVTFSSDKQTALVKINGETKQELVCRTAFLKCEEGAKDCGPITDCVHKGTSFEVPPILRVQQIPGKTVMGEYYSRFPRVLTKLVCM